MAYQGKKMKQAHGSDEDGGEADPSSTLGDPRNSESEETEVNAGEAVNSDHEYEAVGIISYENGFYLVDWHPSPGGVEYPPSWEPLGNLM